MNHLLKSIHTIALSTSYTFVAGQLQKCPSVRTVRNESAIVFSCGSLVFPTLVIPRAFEPHREKTGFLPMRKQRRRSASR